MNTPIFDFVKNYVEKSPTRLHMPGHKGFGPLGIEKFDITEINGADVLYHESGILQESQNNASRLFGSKKTLYSTEGSTLCIRAMLAMVCFYAKELGKKPIVAACRNAHKSFITSCSLLDLDPVFIESAPHALLSEKLSGIGLKRFLESQPELPTALFVTSPDYLGFVANIQEIAEICHEKGILLLVDNAHGSYLHFLPDPCHPLDLGADLVCDSAHKTLPVLTGGAYLHISQNAPEILLQYSEESMALFASTSPSYLILQSLDLCNTYLDSDYPGKLYSFCGSTVDLKKNLKQIGYQIVGDEPLKITVLTKPYGYYGSDFASLLEKQNLYVEFADPDYVVLMLSPESGTEGLKMIVDAFSKISPKEPINEFPPKIPVADRVLTPRQSLFSSNETLPLSQCEGRVLAQPGVTCPPAIPIAICGEKITKEHLKVFQYYGIEKLSVKK